MPILSPNKIGETWLAAGGNPQSTRRAVAHALATSGGNTDAANGLFGFPGTDVDSTSNPLASARTAIEATANGTNFPTVRSDIPGVGELGSLLGSLFGFLTSAGSVGEVLTQFGIYLRWYIMLWTGILLALIGAVIMALGSKPVRAVLGFAGGNVLSGIGFGAGAGITSPRGAQGQQGPPPLIPPVAPTPVPVPTPPPPTAPRASAPLQGRRILWNTAPTTPYPTVTPPSQGGTAHRSMGRAPVTNRTRSPFGSYHGTHRP